MDGPSDTHKGSPDGDRLPFSARLLVVSFALLVSVVGAAIWGEEEANRYAEAAFEIQRRELQTVRLLSLLQDAEIGQRGYLLTEIPKFLEPYTEAVKEIPGLQATVKTLALDDEAARSRAERLDALITERLAGLASGLAFVEKGQRLFAIELVKTGTAKARMDEIRAIVDEINAARAKILTDQRASLERATFFVRVVEALGVAVLMLMAFTIVRQSRLTLEAQRRVRESQAEAIVAATAANKAKSSFLATMSHELRTPMTAIIGMCDLLLAGKQSAEERQITRLLARNAQSLLRLLNDILDFSKVEAGRLTFEDVDFRLSAILEEVRALFGPVASQKGLVLKVAPCAGPKDVFLGDPKRLQQVLANLIGNAIKFTPGGRVVVSNRQSPAEDGRTLVEIEVEDTGDGISDEAMTRLFREFEQEDISTSRRYGGSGLGLSIAKRIVEALGGSIGATSTKGRGSCFFFALPLADGNPANVAARGAASAADASRRLEGLQLDILLVEDTPATQFLVTRMLTLWGHKVTAVSNGEEAVRAANERRWDVILMDMQMPVMDGPEATRIIRAGGGPSAGAPIIALTADAVVENRKTYLAAGCDVVAIKPIDWAVLAGHMATLLGHGGGAAPPAPAPAEPLEVPSEVRWQDLPLLNRALLDELAESLGTDTLAALIGPTMDNLRQYAGQLGELLARGDLAQAARVAHQLKGAGAQIGAERTAGIARLVETESKRGVAVPDAPAWFGQSLDETQAAFDDLFAGVKEMS